MHIPVLLKETIKVLEPKRGEFFIDGTLGGGGHTRALMREVGNRGVILATDWDARAIERFRGEIASEKTRIILRNANYTDIPTILEEEHLPKADGMLLDLGFSSDQIDTPERGFSFQHDGPLDMRYSENGASAADVVNGLREEELADIIWKFGDERMSRKIAKRIIEERRKERITTTKQLADAVLSAFPEKARKARINPATKTFQALRIYVNHEFENIETALQNAVQCVRKGGKIAVITFHSSEDRIVKRIFQNYVKEKTAKLLHKKPIGPTRTEIKENPRSRSAKLRTIELL